MTVSSYNNMRFPLQLLVLLLLVVGSFASTANAEPLQLQPGLSHVKAGSHLRWISASNLTPKDALKLLLSGQYHQSDRDYPSFGTIHQPHWFLLILNNLGKPAPWYTVAGRPYVKQVNAYLLNTDKQLIGQGLVGAGIPFNTRQQPHYHPTFKWQIPNGKSYLLFKIQTNGLAEFPVSMYRPAAFHETTSQHTTWYGFYIGAILILCLYNLLIYFTIRDRSYVYYVCYLFAFGLYLLVRDGLAYQWLWPGFPWWNSHSMLIFNFLILVFAIFFSTHFLRFEKYLPTTRYILHGLAWAIIILIPVTPFFFQTLLPFTALIIMPWPIVITVLAFVVLKKGYTPARYFILAFASVGCSVTLYTLKSVHWIPDSFLLENLLPISVVIEGLILSLALSHRLLITKRENEHLQQQTRHDLEETVNNRTHELNRALNARSNFLAIMSHEIRTPLNGLLGTLDLLKSSPLDDNQQYQVSILESSSNNLLALINDILDFTRIDAGKMPIHRAPLDLAHLAEECCNLYQQRADINGNNLVLEIDDSIQHGEVMGDALRIRQILLNLINNAIKFCRKGNITVQIHRQQTDTDVVYFSVTDTGIGIPINKQNQLFKVFQQIDGSSNRQYGGTGLGLAICQRLTRIMEGSIGVESEAGKGAKFWFQLPLPPANHKTSLPASPTGRSSCCGHLLIVDDNPINLTVAESLCKQLGHEVATCDSGTEAIALLLYGKQHIDAILLDCEMPVMDGFATSRKIIQLQQEDRIADCPIAALTAHAIPEKIEECLRAGMVMHIAKPINLETLDNGLKKLLSGDYEA